MGSKLMFYLLLILFCLSIFACRSGGITCVPSSTSKSSEGSGTIIITWDSNTEKDLGGYRVFYGSSPGKYENCVDVGKGLESSPGVTQYNLTGLIKGRTYYIAVTAYSKNDTSSPFSKEISGMAK